MPHALIDPPLFSCVAGKLQELNSMVTVKVHSGELTEEVVGLHGVVVMCGRPLEEIRKWNDFCHEKARELRAVGSLFC